jgi:uncharacterized protein YjbI with pentapeptide repeats
LDHAVLSNANFSGVDLSKVNLNGVFYEGANFCNATMPDGSLGPCAP